MERLILTLKSVLKRTKSVVKKALDKVSKIDKKQLRKDIKTFLVNAKGFGRSLLSKPTNYIMHITVVGLSLFVSMSTVYGNSNMYAGLTSDASGSVTNRVVHQKVNPRVIADIANAANAPVDVNLEILESNNISLTSSLSFSGSGMVDSSLNIVNAGRTRNEVINYVVKGGDTLSSIASEFNITTNTIKWANNMSSADSIKPGQKLKILPITGTMHKVKEGERLVKIAEKYSASVPQIIEENGLIDKEVKAGQVLLIPDGRVWEPAPEPEPQQTTTRYASTPSYSSGRSVAYGGSGNKFPYGWCTYYVASRRSVTWRGNAGAWLYNARSQGYATGSSPRAGAIIVTTESPVGHVGIVESVSGGSIRISEMNYKGWGIVSSRTISAGSGVIKGYIY